MSAPKDVTLLLSEMSSGDGNAPEDRRDEILAEKCDGAVGCGLRFGQTRSGAIFRRAIPRSIALGKPEKYAANSEIADSHNYMGEAFEKMGDLKPALKSYRQAALVREKNSAADPNHAQYRQSVAVSYQTLGRVYSVLADESKASKSAHLAHLNDARRWYQRSLEIWRELNSRKSLSGDAAANITTIQNELNKCDAALAKL